MHAVAALAGYQDLVHARQSLESLDAAQQVADAVLKAIQVIGEQCGINREYQIAPVQLSAVCLAR